MRRLTVSQSGKLRFGGVEDFENGATIVCRKLLKVWMWIRAVQNLPEPRIKLALGRHGQRVKTL